MIWFLANDLVPRFYGNLLVSYVYIYINNKYTHIKILHRSWIALV